MKVPILQPEQALDLFLSISGQSDSHLPSHLEDDFGNLNNPLAVRLLAANARASRNFCQLYSLQDDLTNQPSTEVAFNIALKSLTECLKKLLNWLTFLDSAGIALDFLRKGKHGNAFQSIIDNPIHLHRLERLSMIRRRGSRDGILISIPRPLQIHLQRLLPDGTNQHLTNTVTDMCDTVFPLVPQYIVSEIRAASVMHCLTWRQYIQQDNIW